MSFSLIAVALGLGLAGSLHCAGMCGPLLLSLSLSRKQKNQLLKQSVIHHLGRISSYVLMGLAAGFFGQAIASGGLQQKLSIISGTLLLIIFILPHLLKGNNRWSGYLKNKWRQLVNKSGVKSTFLIGLVNGFLPCGLVFAALATASATGHSLYGAAFMGFFGLGTMPLLLSISIGGFKLAFWKGKAAGFILPAATVLTASLLILRGMNLGIPYLSPEIESDSSEITCCHENQ